jgi:hypothetical protein
MNPIKYVVVFVVLTLIVILILVNQFAPDIVEPDDKVNIVLLSCKESCGTDEFCLQRCNVIDTNIAVRDEDSSKCSSIEDFDDRRRCTETLAMKDSLDNLDSGSCDKIENQIQQANCLGNVLLYKARADNDSSLCDQILNELTRQVCKNTVK